MEGPDTLYLASSERAANDEWKAGLQALLPGVEYPPKTVFATKVNLTRVLDLSTDEILACRALHCGQRQHLNDDLQIVTLSPALISAPPIDLWPRIVRRGAVPPDTEALLAELENDETLRNRNHAAAHDAN